MDLAKGEELSKAHWAWLETILKLYCASSTIADTKVIYCSAFIHGWKHGYTQAMQRRNSKGQFAREALNDTAK